MTQSLKHFILYIFTNHFIKTRRYVFLAPVLLLFLILQNTIRVSYSYWLSKPWVVWLHIDSCMLLPYARFWKPLLESGWSCHGPLNTPWACLPSCLPPFLLRHLLSQSKFPSLFFLQGCLDYNILSYSIIFLYFLAICSLSKYFSSTYYYQALDSDKQKPWSSENNKGCRK